MDMKPHNILLTDTMESVVMDLGSAGPSDVHITSRYVSKFLYCCVASTCNDGIAVTFLHGRRDALILEDEAATKCSGPFRAPELYQVCHIVIFFASVLELFSISEYFLVNSRYHKTL